MSPTDQSEPSMITSTTTPSNTPALFLDRDGVINQEKEYLHQKEHFQFIDGVLETCQEMLLRGYKLIVITNQSGIARGYYSEQQFLELSQWMSQQFAAAGAPLAGIYHCPHHPDGKIEQYTMSCDCRKPMPGMILQAAKDHRINLQQSILVGDKISDVHAGKAAGIKCNLLVNSGHRLSQEQIDQADGFLPSLAELLSFIDR